MGEFHASVLLQEVVDALQVRKGEKYIDATIGGGGHTFEILRRGGIVLGIDTDKEAIEHVNEEIKNQKSQPKAGPPLAEKIKNWERLALIQGNFKDIEEIAHSNGFDQVSGVIFDLGVSWHQLEKAERGFSFQKEGPLDMRMSQELKIKASDLVNVLTKGELYELFTKLGEERFALAISESIIRARRIKPIETTKDLVLAIQGGVRMKSKASKEHIKTLARIFQALRIAVNDELNNLREVLPAALRLLKSNGRIAVISFHSLEDRIVKYAFLDFQRQGLGVIITKKPIIPSLLEREQNKKSRSAKLRVFEKI